MNRSGVMGDRVHHGQLTIIPVAMKVCEPPLLSWFRSLLTGACFRFVCVFEHAHSNGGGAAVALFYAALAQR